MLGYRKRVGQDLARWRSAGWVTAEGEEAILRDLARPGRTLGLAPALATLGAVLLGFAAMSVIAANWSELPKLLRLAMVFGALWAAYAVAGVLFERRLPAFAHAAVLLGVSLFGVGIMLISQMYHIEGHPPNAVLLWALGALVAGILLRVNSALVLALVLVCVWSIWESSLMHGVNWAFLIGWGAVAGAFLWMRWTPGFHLSGLALSGFVISLGYRLGSGDEHEIVVIAGLAIAGLSFLAREAGRLPVNLLPVGVGYGLTIALAGLFAQQFIEDPKLMDLVMLAILTLALVIGAIAWGSREGHQGVLWLSYVGFSAEILALYFKTLGTLLGNSLFFLLAGLLVIALAVLAHRLHTRQSLLAGGHA